MPVSPALSRPGKEQLGFTKQSWVFKDRTNPGFAGQYTVVFLRAWFLSPLCCTYSVTASILASRVFTRHCRSWQLQANEGLLGIYIVLRFWFSHVCAHAVTRVISVGGQQPISSPSPSACSDVVSLTETHVLDGFWSESSSRRCIGAHIRSESPAWRWKWNRLLIMLFAGFPWEVPAWLDMPSFSGIHWNILQKVNSNYGNPRLYDHGRHSLVFRLFFLFLSVSFIIDMLKPRKQLRQLIRGKSSHYRLHCLGSANKIRPAWGHTVT